MAIEVLPADELPPATPAAPAKPERDEFGRFRPGNLISRKKRCRPNVRGVPGSDLAAPEFRVFANWGRRYGAHRRDELARLHGGHISEGVSGMIESAAMALASSRFTQFKASQTGDVKLLAQSIAMATTARQTELAAWEIASREAAARPRPRPDWWGSDTPAADEAVEPAPDDASDDSEPVEPDAGVTDPADASERLPDGTPEGDT